MQTNYYIVTWPMPKLQKHWGHPVWFSQQIYVENPGFALSFSIGPEHDRLKKHSDLMIDREQIWLLMDMLKDVGNIYVACELPVY